MLKSVNLTYLTILLFTITIIISCQVAEDTSDEVTLGRNAIAQDSFPNRSNKAILNNNANAPIQQQTSNRQIQQVSNSLTSRNQPAYDTFPQPPKPPFARNRIQVALLLDTSNSMDGLIDQAKSQLWKMVNELAKANKGDDTPQVELALFEYGNDWLSMTDGYVRQVSRMTIDLEFVSDRLFELRTNGGSEYCGWVVRDAVKELEWSDNPNDLKMIFIAGNEEYTQGAVNYLEACKLAKEKGIVINTIYCGNYKRGITEMWADGGKCTGGSYMNIDQDKKVVHVPTPYDNKVLELNKQLNDTYFGYGTLGASRKNMQSANDAKSMEYSSANTRTRAFYKTKSNYSNASWDIIDATEKDYDKIMKDIKEEQLPKELQGLSPAERKAFIEKKRKERKELQSRLKELEKKVDAYVVEKKKEMAAEGGEENTLDNVMMSTLRKQAEVKEFSFE